MAKDNSRHRDYDEGKIDKRLREQRDERKKQKHRKPIDDWFTVEDEVEIEVDYSHLIK